LILAAIVAAMLIFFWPGRLNIDTVAEIKEAASGDFTTRSAPLLLALWHPFYGLGFGPGTVFVAQVVTFVIGAYLVLRAALRPLGAAAVTSFIVVWPPVLGNLASVQRDTWFIALLLLAFGLVVRACERDWPVRGRYLVAATVAAAFALASRQNAAPAVVIVCIAIAALYLEHSRPRWSVVWPALAAGVALTAALWAVELGATRLLHPRNVHPEAPLYIYDLAAISVREDQNLFPPDLMPQRGMRAIDRTYDVDSMLGFVFPAPDTIGRAFPRAVGFPDIGDDAASSLRHAWLDAVGDHPGTYLSGRWALWLRQLGVTRNGLSVYPPDVPPDNAGHPFAFPRLYHAAIDYLEAFSHPEPSFYGQAGGNVLYTVWVYLLAALAAAIVFLRRGRPPALVVVGGLGLSALTYEVGLFFVALGTRFRFEYPCVVIGMLCAAILLRFAWGEWRERRH
jgi:hypothetical protein